MRVELRASLCELQLDLGDADGAALTARTLLDVPGARKGNWFLPALAALAHALLAQGRHAEARAAIAELAAASRSRDWEWFGLHAGLMAWLAAVEGRAEAAACLDGFAIAAQQRVGGGGMRSARVREAVAALLGPALDAAVLARLREHGAQLDAQVACAMGLAG